MSKKDDADCCILGLQDAVEKILIRLDKLEEKPPIIDGVARVCDNMLPRLEALERKMNQ